ncbi:hypothetical protein BANRA_05091 [Klebsiella pneumoniae]|nr:hypothetical protein BANRA_05091 [Klebsiella pneumoniae]
MSAALSVLESLASNTGIDHSKEMNVIHDIVAECERDRVHAPVHDFTYGDERHWNKCLRFVLPTLEVEIIW